MVANAAAVSPAAQTGNAAGPMFVGLRPARNAMRAVLLPTLRDVLRQSFGLFAPSPDAAPPRIAEGSDHYRFAVLVQAGYTYAMAAELARVKERTAERWRNELREAATRYFGWDMRYDTIVEYCLDPDRRALYDEIVAERVADLYPQRAETVAATPVRSARPSGTAGKRDRFSVASRPPAALSNA